MWYKHKSKQELRTVVYTCRYPAPWPFCLHPSVLHPEPFYVHVSCILSHSIYTQLSFVPPGAVLLVFP